MTQPTVQQQMLFRVPRESVFEAFVNPDVTTKFWFTHSDGRLETGQTIQWEWRMYGCSTNVRVREIIPNELIKFEWGEETTRSKVEITLEKRSEDSTLVTITNHQFCGDEQAVVAEAIGSMGGFSLVLANAKAYLEHGIDLKLILDHAPDAHVL